MIANISPADYNYEETFSTLRYADRVKEMKKSDQPKSKDDIKSREMMLARQAGNTKQVTLNQKTL